MDNQKEDNYLVEHNPEEDNFLMVDSFLVVGIQVVHMNFVLLVEDKLDHVCLVEDSLLVEDKLVVVHVLLVEDNLLEEDNYILVDHNFVEVDTVKLKV